jgi:hypothetical protein
MARSRISTIIRLFYIRIKWRNGKINNRKILSGIAEVIGASDKLMILRLL